MLSLVLIFLGIHANSYAYFNFLGTLWQDTISKCSAPQPHWKLIFFCLSHGHVIWIVIFVLTWYFPLVGQPGSSILTWIFYYVLGHSVWVLLWLVGPFWWLPSFFPKAMPLFKIVEVAAWPSSAGKGRTDMVMKFKTSLPAALWLFLLLQGNSLSSSFPFLCCSLLISSYTTFLDSGTYMNTTNGVTHSDDTLYSSPPPSPVSWQLLLPKKTLPLTDKDMVLK